MKKLIILTLCLTFCLNVFGEYLKISNKKELGVIVLTNLSSPERTIEKGDILYNTDKLITKKRIKVGKKIKTFKKSSSKEIILNTNKKERFKIILKGVLDRKASIRDKDSTLGISVSVIFNKRVVIDNLLLNNLVKNDKDIGIKNIEINHKDRTILIKGISAEKNGFEKKFSFDEKRIIKYSLIIPESKKDDIEEEKNKDIDTIVHKTSKSLFCFYGKLYLLNKEEQKVTLFSMELEKEKELILSKPVSLIFVEKNGDINSVGENGITLYDKNGELLKSNYSSKIKEATGFGVFNDKKYIFDHENIKIFDKELNFEGKMLSKDSLFISGAISENKMVALFDGGRKIIFSPDIEKYEFYTIETNHWYTSCQLSNDSKYAFFTDTEGEGIFLSKFIISNEALSLEKRVQISKEKVKNSSNFIAIDDYDNLFLLKNELIENFGKW